MSMTGPTRISIVICTFNRHDLLREALESVAALRNPANIPLTLVVVDNSDDSNALPVIEAMRARLPYPLLGIAAHPANISVARNAGAAAAPDEIVAFMDDDQQLDRDWLIAVAEGLAAFPHDVLFGAVEPVLEAPDKADATVLGLFSRRLAAPAGTDLFAIGPAKTQGIALATNNCIFRKSTTLTDATPFDPAFGNGGGEDYDLFCRLERRGRRFGWLPGAKALEFVPAKRCDPAYLERRFYAGGQAFALAVSRNSASPTRQRWRLRLRAILQLIILMLSAPLQWLKGAEARRQLRYRLAGVFGKISFAELEPIYSAPPPGR